MPNAADQLAPYAMHGADTAGRVHPEPAHAYRSPYQRDRDRIVHSSAFRRLAHKTQVFTGDMGDYHRSRLTHTLEVASIARTVGRTLRLNEDLIEALALMHDIGHPPFGHAGEDVLDERLAEHGGFNHNRQALRIVELLETRYPDFPGLNLSREVLRGRGRGASEARGGRRVPGPTAGSPSRSMRPTASRTTPMMRTTRWSWGCLMWRSWKPRRCGRRPRQARPQTLRGARRAAVSPRGGA